MCKINEQREHVLQFAWCLCVTLEPSLGPPNKKSWVRHCASLCGSKQKSPTVSLPQSKTDIQVNLFYVMEHFHPNNLKNIPKIITQDHHH